LLQRDPIDALENRPCACGHHGRAGSQLRQRCDSVPAAQRSIEKEQAGESDQDANELGEVRSDPASALGVFGEDPRVVVLIAAGVPEQRDHGVDDESDEQEPAGDQQR
jgi:hypothetical protein